MVLPAINTSMIVQILLALIVLIILYILTLVILNIDSLIVKDTSIVKPNEITTIIDGYAPISYLANKSFNTFNSFAPNYKKIGKSINGIGGAQFSYQFWIKIEDPNDSLFNDLVLLLKGDINKYRIGLYDMNTNKYKSELSSNYVITAPLIKFVDSYKHLNIQFNTTNNPMTSIDINMNPDNSGQGRRNVLSLLPLNWYLFTIVLIDNYSYSNDTENGINFKFWINDFLYQENSASDSPTLRNNTLKQNDGDLFILPNIKQQGGDFLKMGNIKYFNYALDSNDIISTFQAGHPRYSAVENVEKTTQPAYLTAFNRIDIYNK